jgi:23S rRNA pseudouridine2457 synthase
LFNKPYGVVCQFTPVAGRQTLRDFIDAPGVYPAGRLDHDSEGLVLLTDDGAAQHELTDPKFAHERTYWAQVENVPGDETLERLAAGIEISGYQTRPARVRRIEPAPEVPPRYPPVRFRKTVPTAWIEMTLTEGRNRQVRHMTAAAGHPTLRLIRVGIGGLGNEGLEPGDWRWLTDEEAATFSAPELPRRDSSSRRPRSRSSGSRKGFRQQRRR